MELTKNKPSSPSGFPFAEFCENVTMALTKIEPRTPSRFTYAEFCKNVYQMSQNQELHFSDYKKIFHAELKTLYNKSSHKVKKTTAKEAKEILFSTLPAKEN